MASRRTGSGSGHEPGKADENSAEKAAVRFSDASGTDPEETVDPEPRGPRPRPAGEGREVEPARSGDPRVESDEPAETIASLAEDAGTERSGKAPGRASAARSPRNAQDRNPQDRNPQDRRAATSAAKGDAETLPRDFGDYRLLSRIAQGGMGVVYRATQKAAGRTVALKMILSGTLAGPDSVQRFYNEAEAAARLDHPNIVPIFDVGNQQGQHYYSMAYVDGPTLKQRIAGKPLPPREAAELIRVLSQAMAYAHAQGVVHRDLKPANILLTAEGTPRITDFGLAKQVDSEAGLTVSGQVMGTPSYMAPEQAQGRTDRVGPKSDVYALGAMLYELLLGSPPFQAATTFEVVKQVVEQEPVPPRQWNRGLDRDLETICLRCLEKDPQRRYATAQELSDELRRYLNGEPIRARPLGPLARAWRWSRRHRLAAGLLFTAATLLLMAAVGGVIVGYQQSRLANQLATMVRQRNALLAEQDARVAEQNRNAARLKTLYQEQERLKRTAEFEAERARHVAYVAAMDLARHAIGEGRRARTLELLNRFRPADVADQDLRGFDWYLLRRAAEALEDRPEEPLPPFSTAVRLDCGGGQGRAAAFSPDGGLLAAVGPRAAVRVWNMRNRPPTVVRDFTGGERVVLGVCFSHDGRRLAAATGETSEPGPVLVWDVESGDEILRLESGEVPVQDLRFTPDDTHLVTVDGNAPLHGQVKFWNLATGTLARTLPGEINEIRGVSFSGDGRLLAIGGGWSDSRGEARVLDAKSGTLVRDFPGPTRIVGRLAFSPDGRFLVTAEGGYNGDGCVRVFEVATGTERLQFGSKRGGVYAVAISPDGRRIASAGKDRRIRLWDARSGQQLFELHGHRQEVWDLQFSPDGSSLVSVGHPLAVVFRSREDHQSEILFWDATPPEEPVDCRGHTDQVLGTCLLPVDGQEPLLASLSKDESLRFWNLQSGGLSLGKGEHRIRRPLAMAGSPDGRLVATVANEDVTSSVLALWEVPSGRFVQKTKVPLPYVPQVSFLPDGSAIALCGTSLGSTSAVLVLERSDLSERKAMRSDEALVSRMAWSPAGRWLALNTANHSSRPGRFARAVHSVQLVDVQNGGQPRVLAASETHGVGGMAFSADGRRLATTRIPAVGDGSSPSLIRQYDVESGRVVATIVSATDSFREVAYAGDQLIAVGSSGVVHFFDARTGQPTRRLTGAQAAGGGWCVADDGRLLVTVGPDYRLQVWDVATGRACIVDAKGKLIPASTGPEPASPVEDEDDREELAKLAEAIEAEPAAAGPCARRGQHHLRRGRWSLAAADYRRAAQRDPDALSHWMRAAVLLVLADDQEGYRTLCDELLQRFGDTQRIEYAERVCKSCLIGPWKADREDPLPLEVFVRPLEDGTAAPAFVPWGQAARALAACRQGQPEQALQWGRKAAETQGLHQVQALGWAVLALACQELGREDEARQALAEGLGLLPIELRSFFESDIVRLSPVTDNAVAYDWLVPQALLRQAAARLETP